MNVFNDAIGVITSLPLRIPFEKSPHFSFNYSRTNAVNSMIYTQLPAVLSSKAEGSTTTVTGISSPTIPSSLVTHDSLCCGAFAPLFPLPLEFVDILLPLTYTQLNELCNAPSERKEAFRMTATDSFTGAKKDIESVLFKVIMGPYYVIPALSNNCSHDGDSGTTIGGSSVVGTPTTRSMACDSSGITPYTISLRKGNMCRDPVVLIEWFEALDTLCNYSGIAFVGLNRKMNGASVQCPPQRYDEYGSVEEAKRDQETAKIIVEMVTMQSQLTNTCRSYFCTNILGIKCLAMVIQVLDNCISDPFVVASGLLFLYNLLHPASINMTRNRCYVSAPFTSDACTNQPISSDPSEEQKSHPCLFLNDDDFIECGDLNVRSEIKLMNKSICPVKLKGLTSPTRETSYMSLNIPGCVVTCVRDAKLVRKLEKHNLNRTLFSVICKHAVTAEVLGVQMSTEATASMRCVYLANMLLASIGGATKQREEDWILSRIALSRTMDGRDILNNTSGNSDSVDVDEDDADEDSDGMEGDGVSDLEENDDEDTTSVSSEKETPFSPSGKEAINAIGGASTGPLRACSKAEKMGMLARLSGAMSAMISLLKALVSHVAPSVGETSRDPTVTYSQLNSIVIINTGEYYKWNTVMMSSSKKNNCTFGPDVQYKMSVTFDGQIAALLAGLATICVGEPNVSSALKKGLLTVLTGIFPNRLKACITMNQPSITIEQSSPYFTTIRWGYELMFKLCCPIESGLSSKFSSASCPSLEMGLAIEDTNQHFRDGFVKAKGISMLLNTLLLSVCCRPTSAQGFKGTIPFLSFSLFTVCSDLLYILVSNIPTAQQHFKSMNGMFLIANAIGNAALIDGSPRNKCRPLILPLTLSCWVVVLRSLFKLFDVKDIPVGNDNDLAWVPPPELIQKLKTKNEKGPAFSLSDKADNKSDKVDDENEENESDDSSENEEEESDENAEDDIIENRTELEHLSPELKYAVNVQTSTNHIIHPKTNLTGVINVKHVKPFTEPRPTPSSPQVIENYPQGEPLVCSTLNNGKPIPLTVIEPLLVQTERQKIMVIKLQLLRFLFPKSVSLEVVYDDMDRNKTLLSRTKYGSNYAGDVPQLLTLIDCDKTLSLQLNVDPLPDTPVEYCKEIHIGNQDIHRAFLPTQLCLSANDAVMCVPKDLPHFTNHQSLPLKFASNFECGNLKRAIRVMDDEYDLILHSDINTAGFIQWFYFRVEGMVPGVPYRFNIINMEKTSSTFNYGQRPLLFSDRRFADTNGVIGWTREGYNILYYQNNFKRKSRQKKSVSSTIRPDVEANERKNNRKEKEEDKIKKNAKKVVKRCSETQRTIGKHVKHGVNVKPSARNKNVTMGYHYTLSFTIVFPSSEDKCYICNCYPYSYSDLIGYLRMVDSADNGIVTTPYDSRKLPRSSIFIQNLCSSLCGNATPIVTITNCTTSVSSTTPVNSSIIANRPVVILTARVHPGESNASYMMKGVMDFLLDSQNSAAEFLRNSFVFKIVPMLNPDGVINGNHRCSISGKDLNRDYGKPRRWENPAIFYLKALVRHIKEIERRTIIMYADFHGHSRCQNFVIYGCGDNNTTVSLLKGLAGQAAAKLTSIERPISTSSTSTSHAKTPSCQSLNGKSTNPPEKKLKKKLSHPFLEPHPGVVPEKVFPLILNQLTPFFALKSSTFKIEKNKRNTGRVVFYRELGIRLSYTVEASMMGGVGCDFCFSSFDGSSQEQVLRAAAKWGILRKQTSGISALNNTHRTMNAHYNVQHYVTFGAMFLKALGEMWKIHSNPQPIITNTQPNLEETFSLNSFSKSLGDLILDTEAAVLKAKKTPIGKKKDVSASKKLEQRIPLTKKVIHPKPPVVNGLRKAAQYLNTAYFPLGQTALVTSSLQMSCKGNTRNESDRFEINYFSDSYAAASKKMSQVSDKLVKDSESYLIEVVTGMNEVENEDEDNKETDDQTILPLLDEESKQTRSFAIVKENISNGSVLPQASRVASPVEICTILKVAFKQGPILTRTKLV